MNIEEKKKSIEQEFQANLTQLNRLVARQEQLKGQFELLVEQEKEKLESNSKHEQWHWSKTMYPTGSLQRWHDIRNRKW